VFAVNDVHAELARIAGEVNELFFIPASIDSLLAPLQELILTVPPLFSQCAEAFCTSVRSVVSMAGIPYIFALTASQGRRYQLLLCAAELEASLSSSGSDATSSDDAARNDAQKRMQELVGSSEGRAVLNHDACGLLIDLGRTSQIADAAAQLLLQTTVLTWGAFEVLSREIFRIYLNCMPTACGKLLADPDIRKRFDLSRISVEKLADFDFNLSGKLGDLLVEQNDLSDLPGVKAALFALFPEDSRLRHVLSERILWILFQRRNLIVHRRGIIDARYVGASGEELPLGSQLRVRPADIKSYLGLVAKAAYALTSIGLRIPSASLKNQESEAARDSSGKPMLG
jgi:hypothetical protein